MDIVKGYEFFDHTADIGIRAQSSTLEGLLIAMAQGLTEIIAEGSVFTIQQTRAIELSAPDVEQLVLVWLQELLFWFSTDRFLPVAYGFEAVTPTTIRGQVRGDVFDPARHLQGREVKAITHHGLRVWRARGAWRAEVIVDI